MLKSSKGSQTNPVNIGKHTTLVGIPDIKTEKPHTIIHFPGGDLEIARTTEGKYWVHVAVTATGTVENCRIDCLGRYNDEANTTLAKEIKRGDVEHIAFLIGKD